MYYNTIYKRLIYQSTAIKVSIPRQFCDALQQPRFLKCEIRENKIFLTKDVNCSTQDIRKIHYSPISHSGTITIPQIWAKNNNSPEFVRITLTNNNRIIISLIEEDKK